MAILNSIVSWVMKKRIHQIELFMKYPHEVQEEWRKKLLSTAKDTDFGKQYGFAELAQQPAEALRQRVPIHAYEDLYPQIERVLRGEKNVLWPGDIRWFAKSSGTTNARSKYIPVSTEALEQCHFAAGKDLIAIYVNNYPDSGLFSGKSLGVGGSHQLNHFDQGQNSYYGDVSAVIMQNLPVWAQFVRTPNLEIALMDEWEAKIEKMARATMDQNVTNLAGVPTWIYVLLKRILELKGASNILEVWPNLEAFFHGAVAFGPYRRLFEALIPSPGMHYVETYNASEGFFGIQDQTEGNSFLLMLDYGIYYEFIPLDELEKESPKVIGLDEVEKDKVYAVLISTNGGLWRYNIGDTIRFTETNPYRVKIAGRTKHFINAFGEELMIENAEQGIEQASQATGAVIENFTAAPRFLGEGQKGCHEWIIEFRTPPSDGMERFTMLLDENLRQINSDYDAKRHRDIALEMLTIHTVPQGTFYNWMKKRGKLGGQHKVPRLSNSREYLEDILEMLK